jgi:hypothetical protein
MRTFKSIISVIAPNQNLNGNLAINNNIIIILGETWRKQGKCDITIFLFLGDFIPKIKNKRLL